MQKKAAIKETQILSKNIQKAQSAEFNFSPINIKYNGEFYAW